jgi:hypothetical protein
MSSNNQALLFDVATRTDAFRQAQCLPDVLHILPSRAMRADRGLAFPELNKQFLPLA